MLYAQEHIIFLQLLLDQTKQKYTAYIFFYFTGVVTIPILYFYTHLNYSLMVFPFTLKSPFVVSTVSIKFLYYFQTCVEVVNPALLIW